MSKTFTQAPKPKPLTAEIISAFERGGAGQDTQTHIPPKVEMLKPAKEEKQEPTKRLSIDLPKSLHRRFKTACSNADKKMVDEVMDFIECRSAELEQKK
jgi:hypothetical protein